MVAAYPGLAEARRLRGLYAGDAGELARARGDIDAAGRAFDEALAFAEELSAAAPEDPVLAGDVVTGWLHVGDIRRARSDYPRRRGRLYPRPRPRRRDLGQGRRPCRATCATSPRPSGGSAKWSGCCGAGTWRRSISAPRSATSKQVALADPDNELWQIDMVETLILIGDAEVAEATPAAAMATCAQAVDLAATILASDPAQNFNHSLLARALMGHAEAAAAAGDIAAAAADYRRALALIEPVVAAEPGNEFWLGDLGRAHIGLGNIGVDALEHVTAALAIFRQMQRDGQLAAGGPALLRQLEAWQAALQAGAGGGVNGGGGTAAPAADPALTAAPKTAPPKRRR